MDTMWRGRQLNPVDWAHLRWREVMLQLHSLHIKYYGPAALSAAVSLAATGIALAAPCTGPGAPVTTQTECLTAVQIPGNPLRSFDISWVNPDVSAYYLADRSNPGIDIINTKKKPV